MGRKTRHLSFLQVLMFSLFSCVTINIYFPAAAVEKAADKIVQETWGKEAPAPEADKPGPEGLLDHGIPFAGLRIGITEARAEEADVDVTTPSIRALKESIRQRAESIKPFMDKGNAGISSDGLIVLRTDEGLGLKDKAALTRLISAENKDREALYLEIAKANNFGSERVMDIKGIFAKSWIKNAQKGWWVQSPDGTWSQQ